MEYKIINTKNTNWFITTGDFDFGFLFRKRKGYIVINAALPLIRLHIYIIT